MTAKLDITKGGEVEFCQIIKEMREEGKSACQIARELEVGKGVVERRFRAMGIDIFYKFKQADNFFKDITTPEQAWLLGWIMTDGSISGSNLGSLRFHLQKRDKEVLLKMKRILPEAKISEGKNSVRFNLYSKKLVKSLMDLGIKEYKIRAKKPLDLPKELLHHFWRGAIEGDGSVGLYESKWGKYGSIALTGTYEMCQGFKDFFNFNNKISKTNSKGTYIISKVNYNSLFWENIYFKLYDPYSLKNGLFLKRKHDIFEKILKELPEKVIS